MPGKVRPPTSITLQLAVYRRDKWLCQCCRRPVVFGLAMRQLANMVEAGEGAAAVLPAYYTQSWRRDLSPLLDELGASIDHIEAFSRGGKHAVENFATICARCNARKGARSRAAFAEELKAWQVTGKFGEPVAWDGLTSVFIALAPRATRELTTTERSWLRALQAPGPDAP